MGIASFDIPSKAPGLALHLERSAPSGKSTTQAVLLVHGNFFPASTAFGLELPGGAALERLEWAPVECAKAVHELLSRAQHRAS